MPCKLNNAYIVVGVNIHLVTLSTEPTLTLHSSESIGAMPLLQNLCCLYPLHQAQSLEYFLHSLVFSRGLPICYQLLQYQGLVFVNCLIHSTILYLNNQCVILFTNDQWSHGDLFSSSLSELEMTRDDLLIQLYQSSEAFVDKNTVEFISCCFLFMCLICTCSLCITTLSHSLDFLWVNYAVFVHSR